MRNNLVINRGSLVLCKIKQNRWSSTGDNSRENEPGKSLVDGVNQKIRLIEELKLMVTKAKGAKDVLCSLRNSKILRVHDLFHARTVTTDARPIKNQAADYIGGLHGNIVE